MCYTCVRECPVKAIRITEGQAQVIGERCIACGNCVRVCSQNAKLLRSTAHEVQALLDSGGERGRLRGPELSRRVHRHGPHADGRHVAEAGFQPRGRGGLRRRPRGPPILGAAARRATAIATSPRPARPSSTTSSVTIRNWCRLLAPIVSPMIATARALRRDLRRRTEDRVHRAVHRQEDGGPERARSPARSTPRSRFPSCGSCSPRRASIRPTSSPAISTRPAAAPAACFPSAAACSRRPISARTCSPARSWPRRAAATCWRRSRSLPTATWAPNCWKCSAARAASWARA